MSQVVGVDTPQGHSGRLAIAKDGSYVFGYNHEADVHAEISLLMPHRETQYTHNELHPIFQMNLPEGFMLEELRNRLAKRYKLDPMMLLALGGSQSPIGRVHIDPLDLFKDEVQKQKDLKGESLDEILGWDGKESLFEELVNKYILRAGISGVQPKVLVPSAVEDDTRATIRTEELIVKSGRAQYPGLAANEFLCMSIAKAAGLTVPEFYLSKNRELFIMKRFDRNASGQALGFEDMAALARLAAERKYERSYEFVAKLIAAFVTPEHTQLSLEQLFDSVALSCILGNGDAHLKNFGLLYTDPATEDVRLAPAYDIVNTTAYIPEDSLALELKGQKSFFSARRGLLDFANDCQVRNPKDRIQVLVQTTEMVLRREEEIAASVPHVVAAIKESAERFSDISSERMPRSQRSSHHP
jgi:serine/threonine-protein kinase HipA